MKLEGGGEMIADENNLQLFLDSSVTIFFEREEEKTANS